MSRSDNTAWGAWRMIFLVVAVLQLATLGVFGWVYFQANAFEWFLLARMGLGGTLVTLLIAFPSAGAVLSLAGAWRCHRRAQLPAAKPQQAVPHRGAA